MAILNCLVCNGEFKRKGVVMAEKARTCSKVCLSIYTKSKTDHTPNAVCRHCGKSFWTKPSQLTRYGGKYGNHCSVACLAETRKVSQFGPNNPNYRARNYDQGYRVQHYELKGREKVHRAVAKEVLGGVIPKGLVVHHRSCDIRDNTASNLAVLSESDHRWLHKQFGNATLWAYCNNKIDLESLVEWADDRKRARRLLPLSVLDQIGYIGEGMRLKMALRHPDAVLPRKGHVKDACWDLTAVSVDESNPRYVEYDTGVSVEIPEGHAVLLFPRSSVSNYDLTLANSVGVVDPGYLGTLKLRFRRTGDNIYKVGDRVGQFMLIENRTVDIEFEEVEELSDTERGDGGFGSTN